MKILIVPMLILLAICSCKKDEPLPNQIIGSGVIVKDALIPQKLITLNMRSNEFVIKSSNENIYDLQVSFDNGITLDTIDFSKYTLIGKYANGLCSVVFERNVERNTSKSNYLFKISVHQQGECEILYESMNWVLIPKIEDDYDVVFQVE